MYPSGTVTRTVNMALSEGWSLQGNTTCAASAWLAMASPSAVCSQPPSLSPVYTGSLVCRTVMRVRLPRGAAPWV